LLIDELFIILLGTFLEDSRVIFHNTQFEGNSVNEKITRDTNVYCDDASKKLGCRSCDIQSCDFCSGILFYLSLLSVNLGNRSMYFGKRKGTSLLF